MLVPTHAVCRLACVRRCGTVGHIVQWWQGLENGTALDVVNYYFMEAVDFLAEVCCLCMLQSPGYLCASLSCVSCVPCRGLDSCSHQCCKGV